MLNVETLIEKINYLRGNKSLSDRDRNILNQKKTELSDNLKNKKINLLGINNQLYEIAKIYLGLDELERWFPEETKKDRKQPPLVQ